MYDHVRVHWLMRVACGLMMSAWLSGCGNVLANQTLTPSPTPALPTPRPTHTPRPTPTLTDATPVPGAALLTPTPIIYIVQAGDTLIPIANKFGVSVADLIAANGNLDPTRLQIGQRLIIPAGARDVSAAASSQAEILPTPTPLPYEVRGLNGARTPAGGIDIMGEVYNPTTVPLENVRVLIALQDESGVTLREIVTFITLDVLPSGQSSPFRALILDPPPEYARFVAFPLRGEASRSSPIVLSVSDLAGRVEGVQFRVTGLLTNSFSQPLSGARLLVTAYDDQRRVIGYRYVSLETPLQPGASAPFDVQITTVTRPVASFTLYAEGTP